MQHLQSEQSSEQNTVRTDFTLKYFELDDAFNKSTLVKVSSTKSENFIRSWQSFSLSRGDDLISWSEGGLEELYALCAAIKGSPIDNLEQLESFLLDVDLAASQKKVLFINAELVKSEDVRSVLEIYQRLEGGDKKAFKVLFFVKSREKFNAEYASFNSVLRAELLLDAVQGAEVSPSISFNKKIVISLIAITGIAVGIQGWQYYVSNLQTKQPVSTSDSVAKKNKLETDKKGSKSNPETDLSNQTKRVSEVVPSPSVETSSVEQATAAMQTVKLDTASSVTLSSLEAPTQLVSKAKVDAVVNTATTSDGSELTGKENMNAEIEGGSSSLIAEQKTQGMLPKDGGGTSSTADKVSPDVLKKEPRTKKKEQVKISAASGQPVITLKPVITLESETNEAIGQSSIKSEQAVFKGFLDSWLQSWQQQNFEDYRRFYDDNFSGRKGFDHQQWLTWRKKRIEKPAWIKLSYANFVAKKSVSENEYVLTFTLKYSAPNYRDKTEKRLIIKSLDSSIKILKEENLKVTKL